MGYSPWGHKELYTTECSSKCGLSPREQLERQVKLHSFTQDEALLSCPNSSGTLQLESEMVKWQPTPVFLPGESHGLMGCNPWGLKELDVTERLTLSLHFKDPEFTQTHVH